MANEPKSGLEIIFSPEGLIILPFAIIIDIIGIILVLFLLDDFWITDIIAFSFIGFWSMFRSQVALTAEAQAPSQVPSYDYSSQKKIFAKKIKKLKHASQVAAEKSREAARAAEIAKQSGDMEKAALEAKRAQKFSRAARTARNIKWLEFIPYVGSFPFWTISVYLTIKYS